MQVNLGDVQIMCSETSVRCELKYRKWVTDFLQKRGPNSNQSADTAVPTASLKGTLEHCRVC